MRSAILGNDLDTTEEVAFLILYEGLSDATLLPRGNGDACRAF